MGYGTDAQQHPQNALLKKFTNFWKPLTIWITENMKEELGDVLLQVVFHARLAEEEGAFTMQDVVDEIVNKLIRRHPHVYGTIEVGSSDEVLQNWDAIKQTEKKERTHVLDGITKGQPALMRAYKLNSKAAKAGFDWPDNDVVWNKVMEEAAELKEAVALKKSRKNRNMNLAICCFQ